MDNSPLAFQSPWPASLPSLQRELRSLLALALPGVMAELGWMLMSVVDTAMVGRLSAAAIGAVGLGSVLYYSIVLFGMGLLLSMDPLVARSFGAGNLRTATTRCIRESFSPSCSLF